jgi:hypothetical protein
MFRNSFVPSRRRRRWWRDQASRSVGSVGETPNATYLSDVGRAILPAAVFQPALSRHARVFGAAVAG